MGMKKQMKIWVTNEFTCWTNSGLGQTLCHLEVVVGGDNASTFIGWRIMGLFMGVCEELIRYSELIY